MLIDIYFSLVFEKTGLIAVGFRLEQAIQMWLPTSTTTRAWVTWRPPQASLHYGELYRGLWEFVRKPPRREAEPRGREYLATLCEWPHGRLQCDRIRWVREWLDALPAEEERREIMGEGLFQLMVAVCHEPPVEQWRVGSWKLRAG